MAIAFFYLFRRKHFCDNEERTGWRVRTNYTLGEILIPVMTNHSLLLSMEYYFYYVSINGNVVLNIINFLFLFIEFSHNYALLEMGSCSSRRLHDCDETS